jgi:hypothetical protein
MKNLHILPTDKPSRLSILNSGKLNFGAEIMSSSNSKPQNIYITSDEEIKEGDWCYNSINNNVYKKEIDKLSFAYEYKIILTTDQDLINDGVQAIDDEFLEWFIKNPSCESVEVDHRLKVSSSEKGFVMDNPNYNKIIIPKEEQKQHLIDIMRGDEELGLYGEPKQIKCYCGHTTYCDCSPLEESKQETLEKVKDLSYWRANAEEDYMKVPISVLRYINELENRMYSEEDLHKAYCAGSDFDMSCLKDEQYYMFKEWFEQFKKK